MSEKNTPPVIFIIFNRPEIARRTFERIRLAKPPKLFLVADGPRANRPGEAEKCNQCREIVRSMIDWDCEVKTNFAEVNMGCRDRVASGITWAFEHVDEAIILEDDCLPNMSFFRFCREMLDMYRDDKRVMVISGSNHDWSKKFSSSYCFTKRVFMWGWATWKRAWDLFDVDMKLWQECKKNEYLKGVFEPLDYVMFSSFFEDTHGGMVNTWDWQFMFNVLCNHGLDVLPRVNMIRNIGFEPEATHTADPFSKDYYYLDEEMPFPLEHPKFMIPLDSPTEITQQYKSSNEMRLDIQQRIAHFQQLLNARQFTEVISYFKDTLRNCKLFQQIYVYYLAFAYLALGNFERAAGLIDDLVRLRAVSPEMLQPFVNHPLVRERLQYVKIAN